MLAYPIKTEDDEGTVLIKCPDFPEVITFAETDGDVDDVARDAIEEALASRIAHGEDVPLPSKGKRLIAMGVTTTLKVRLYEEMRRQGKTRADVQRALNWKRESVDRLFRIRHASKPDQLEAALATLGRHIDIEVRP